MVKNYNILKITLVSGIILKQIMSKTMVGVDVQDEVDFKTHFHVYIDR